MAPPPDLQLDFWTIPEPRPANAPAEAPIVSGQRLGGERTLEGLILGAWEELAARRLVQCPVCDGVMAPVYGALHARPVSATCRDCGSQLS